MLVVEEMFTAGRERGQLVKCPQLRSCAMTDPTPLVLLIVLLAGAGAVVWMVGRGPVNLRIRVKAGQVQAEGASLAHCRSDVEEFFREDLTEVRSAWIEGYYHRPQRRLQLRCRGLTSGQQQRLRNFLLTVL
jgi:hypothetical protein